jgi:ring-1,2-phenylacetyl-CoA epoxidase subunit PaaC
VISTTADYAVALGDDALVLAQRCAEWVTRAPELEEDVALANIGLDLLGHARLLYGVAVAGTMRTEDDLAYRREPEEFANLWLCELPNGDFAVSMARLLVMGCYSRELYERLLASTEPGLAAVAQQARREVRYHVQHAAGWVRRLGLGTELSDVRMRAGLAQVWPHVPELFAVGWLDRDLVARGVAVDPADLERPMLDALGSVLSEAELPVPAVAPAAGGGRLGVHTPELTELLAELQSVARAHPGASW